MLRPLPRQLFLYSTPVLGSGDAQLARVYAFRDVTKEREADRLKSEFISMVSHELRTPLTSVKGYLDLFLDSDSESLSEPQHTLLAGVNRNVDRLLTLIGDLLDAASIEAGRIELHADVLDVARLVERSLIGMQVTLQEKQQTVRVDVGQDLPDIVGDPDRLDQILVNLISNASKYSGPGTTIRIMATVVDDMVAIAVQDQGIGIHQDEMPRIFERFFRARNPATSGVGGTGLGLSITRSLVELHGGALSVESEPGVGSTFTFTIPIVAMVAGGTGTAPEQGA